MFSKGWVGPLSSCRRAIADHALRSLLPHISPFFASLFVSRLLSPITLHHLCPICTLASHSQQAASRTAAYDIGFVPTPSASATPAKFVYLLNSDDFSPSQIPRDAFVVYQGHHGDLGAQYADVCLPGSAYTEKSSTWVNTEGRAQQGRAAVGGPGAAREDWKIVRALSEVLGEKLPYDEVSQLRDRMWEIAPSLVKLDVLEKGSSVLEAVKALRVEAARSKGEKKVGGRIGAFKKPFDNFYRTDPISRSSVTMGKCTVSFRFLFPPVLRST